MSHNQPNKRNTVFYQGDFIFTADHLLYALSLIICLYLFISLSPNSNVSIFVTNKEQVFVKSRYFFSMSSKHLGSISRFSTVTIPSTNPVLGILMILSKTKMQVKSYPEYTRRPHFSCGTQGIYSGGESGKATDTLPTNIWCPEGVLLIVQLLRNM